MPAVWELRCPKRVRSRRTLFHEGVKSLRRDVGVRRVACSKTLDFLRARVTFWNEGPVDAALAQLREEFAPNRPAPQPSCFGAIRQVALDFETSMGAMVSSAARVAPSLARVNFSIQELAARTLDIAPLRPEDLAEYIALHGRQRIVQPAIATPNGRARLAASMMAPIRRPRDYSGIARRMLLVDPLPEGALPIYDRDPLPNVPPDMIFFASDPEFVGRMPVRQELTVLSADDPNREPLGYTMIERMPMPTSRIFFQDFQYGAGSNISIPSLAPIAVPAWCVPGTWVYDRMTRRYGLVRRIFDGNRAGISLWFQGHLSRKGRVLTGRELHVSWNPCDGPNFPRESWWEDLLRDDFANL